MVVVTLGDVSDEVSEHAIYHASERGKAVKVPSSDPTYNTMTHTLTSLQTQPIPSSSTPTSRTQKGGDDVTVAREHVASALAGMRGSVSESDRAKYDAIVRKMEGKEVQIGPLRTTMA